MKRFSRKILEVFITACNTVLYKIDKYFMWVLNKAGDYYISYLSDLK